MYRERCVCRGTGRGVCVGGQGEVCVYRERCVCRGTGGGVGGQGKVCRGTGRGV